jgi:hypothetical protein
MKNKVHTLSYFKKRLKDSGYVVWDIVNKYAYSDPRKWTVLVNPGSEAIFVTCVLNREEVDMTEFELNDSGQRFQKNLSIRTSSMEVITNFLNKKNILPDDTYKKAI